MKPDSQNLLSACDFSAKLSAESQAVFKKFPANWTELYVRAIEEALAGKSLLLKRIRAVTAIDYPLPEGVSVREEEWKTDSGNLRVRFYVPAAPKEKLRPAVLYIHGGGWCMGGIENSSLLCGKMAAQTGATVVVPAYRLSPEFPFPSALDDICAVVKILRERAAEYKIDAEKIFWAGDSAGGQLCLTAALRLLDEASKVHIAGIALFYPVVSLNHSDENALTGSRREFDKNSMLSNALFEAMIRSYVEEELREERYVSPLRTELSGLPEIRIFAAECDILRDGAYALSEKLRRDGVRVSCETLSGVPHAFALMPGFEEAQTTLLTRVAEFISG